MPSLGPLELEQIERVLDRTFGGSPETGRRPQTEAAILSRMKGTGERSLEKYLSHLDDDPEEQGLLAALLTVGETYFFRTPQHFDAVREVVLPQLRAAGRTHLRILSAACATGEEPYSLAIILAELAEKFPVTAEIEAIDLNPEALKRARSAIYTEWSLRGVEPARVQRFFKAQGKQWKLSDPIRNAVRFSSGNLMNLQAGQFGTSRDGQEGFDIIFCRNALIYFTPASIKRTVDRLARMLRPNGYLFLGPTETLRGVSRAFQLCHTNETFYYRLGHGAPPKKEENVPEMEMLELPSAPQTSISTAWFDEIQRSSDRVKAIAGRERKRPAPSHAKLAEVLGLIEDGQLATALDLTERLPEKEKSAQPTRLMRAALMMQSGHQQEARVLCEEVLAKDSMSSEAHYLLSLGLEDTQPAEARAHAESAAYLDPSFAMAQMRVGMLQARSGEPRAARVSFGDAIDALAKEDRRRLALFGGGFSRAGLRAVCESEFNRLGAGT